MGKDSIIAYQLSLRSPSTEVYLQQNPHRSTALPHLCFIGWKRHRKTEIVRPVTLNINSSIVTGSIDLGFVCKNDSSPLACYEIQKIALTGLNDP